MKKNKYLKIICILAITLSVVTTTQIRIYAGVFESKIRQNYVEAPSEAPPSIFSQTAILIDSKTGAILYDKSMHERREPASTTKVMTALLAIENLDKNKEIIVDKESEQTEGSQIYLAEGEKLSVEELINALLIQSANDAAVALAKEISETIPNFASKMNQKARELGAKNTNFVNPHGLHDDNHYTTAYDLAMIARAAMTNERFRGYVSTEKYNMKPTNIKPEERHLRNTNRLLYDKWHQIYVENDKRDIKYEYAIGIKTGYTDEAGTCLISAAKKDGTELIAVTLKAEGMDRYADSITLLEWGFRNYKTEKVLEKNTKIKNLAIKKGVEESIPLVNKNECYITLSKSKNSKMKKVLKIQEDIEAPIAKNTEMGSLDIFDRENLLQSIPLYSGKSLEKKSLLPSFLKKVKISKKYLVTISILAPIVALLILALMVMYLRKKNTRKQKQKRKDLAMKIAMEREMEKLHNNRRRYREEVERRKKY